MATNRIDILDPALLRPGRIDRKIEFPPPGPEARVTILRIHSRKVSIIVGHVDSLLRCQDWLGGEMLIHVASCTDVSSTRDQLPFFG